MLSPRTLRGRLALGYATALTLGLILFAIVTLALLEAIQRSTLDDRLRTASDAVLAIVDTKAGSAELDDNDRRQFAQIVGASLLGAVLSRSGSVVATNAATIPPAIGQLSTASAPQSQVAAIHAATGPARAFVRPIFARGHVVGTVAIWSTTEPITQLDMRVAIGFVLLIPILAAIAIVVGGIIARKALEPLESISQLASEIEAKDLSRRLALQDAPEELERFVFAFNRMLDRLEAAFERQRRFTEDASHELRTPLSVIRAEADLALMRERNGDEYRRTLETIAREADGLEALTHDLLATARAESGGVASGACVDLGLVAAEASERLRFLAATQGSTIRSDVASVDVAGDASALSRVVASLVENALKHGRPRGTVHVIVRAIGEDAELTVRDDGDGFSSDALQFGLDRFWRGGSARSKEGAGLGLAIVRAIVAAVGGTITLSNHAGGGGQVTVTLPRAARCSNAPPKDDGQMNNLARARSGRRAT